MAILIRHIFIFFMKSDLICCWYISKTASMIEGLYIVIIMFTSYHKCFIYVMPKLQMYMTIFLEILQYGPLARYVKLRVAHAPGMPGTFSPSPRVSDPDMHHGTCVTHVPWCMSGSLISSFPWRRWRGKRSRHSRRMRNPQFCVSGKRPMPRVVYG